MGFLDFIVAPIEIQKCESMRLSFSELRGWIYAKPWEVELCYR